MWIYRKFKQCNRTHLHVPRYSYILIYLNTVRFILLQLNSKCHIPSLRPPLEKNTSCFWEELTAVSVGVPRSTIWDHSPAVSQQSSSCCSHSSVLTWAELRGSLWLLWAAEYSAMMENKLWNPSKGLFQWVESITESLSIVGFFNGFIAFLVNYLFLFEQLLKNTEAYG